MGKKVIYKYKWIKGKLLAEETSELRTIVMASFLTMMATTSLPQSSWQPHHHEVGNAWKHSRARNPVFFRVARGGSLFPRLRGSIGESGRQKVHRTVARARFHIKVKRTESMYVCMYVWLCMYEYVCMIMYVWICMYEYVCMYMYVWLCMYACMHACMHDYMITYDYVCMFIYVCM